MLRLFRSAEKEWGRRLKSATQAQREGRTNDAQSDFEVALQIAAEMAEDDPRRLRTLVLAADFHVSVGQSDAAQRCYDQLLQLTERSNGADDPAVARVLSQMAAAQEVQGKLGRAERLYRRALRIYEATVGEGHRRTGLTAAALANVLRQLEEWKEAAQFYRTAIAIERRVAIEDTATLLRLYLQLSQVYIALEQDSLLEELYVSAAGLVQKNAGHDQLEIAAVLHRLASFYRHRQRWEEAARQYELILETQRRSLGNRHPALASTLRQLGHISEIRERQAEAMESYRLAAEMLADGVSRTEIILHAAALCDCARVLQKRGWLEEARATYALAIERSRAGLPSHHPNLATPLTGLSCLLEELGELDRAEMLANEALELCHATGKQTHPNTVQVLELMARLAERRQDWGPAEAYVHALMEAEKNLHRPDPLRDVARLRHLLGIELNLGKFRKALEHCNAAIDLLRYNPELADRPERKEVEFERKRILDLQPQQGMA